MKNKTRDKRRRSQGFVKTQPKATSQEVDEQARKSAKSGELRQDVVTGKWVLLAPGRGKKPADMVADRKRPVPRVRYKADCPFCNVDDFPQRPDVLRLPDDDQDWQVHIFGNKYPAFSAAEEFRSWQTGPFRAMEAVGYHELLTTRWHNQTEAMMSVDEHALVLEALVLRYRELKVKPSVNFIQVIRNHGPQAGGSQEHPHHQIFTVPVLPSDRQDSLYGAERYASKHNEEPFGAVLRFEEEDGQRIVFSNEQFVVFCPYASRVPFETWIMPRQHEPYFESMGPDQREALAQIMQQLFRCLYVGLKDPPFNYYVHSAPCDDTGFVCDTAMFKNYRWHIEVLPRLKNLWGGFELGTGLEINTLKPEAAADFLRGVDITKFKEQPGRAAPEADE